MAEAGAATSRALADAAVPAAAAALAGDLGFLLARASAVAVSAAGAALAPHGLRVRSYSVLALVADGAAPSQRDLADALRLDPSRVVALVDELEQQGLVRRDPDPGDRRARLVTATPEGRDLARRAGPAVRAAATAALDDAQRSQLVALLTPLAFPDGA